MSCLSVIFDYFSVSPQLSFRMADSDFYSDGDSEYKDFTEEEINMINSYNYDDYQGFSDVKLFDMQNDDR